MTIQVEFEFPSSISDEVYGKDKLVIKVLNPTMFLSESSLMTIKNETLV